MPVDPIEQRLCDRIAVRRDELIRDLAAHVSIPTGHGHAAGLEQYRAEIVGRLERLGGSVRMASGRARPEWVRLPSARDAPDAAPPVVVAQGPHRIAPRVLIVGHLDTVHDPDGSFRAMTLAADGRTATGPGVVDMKGGILVALAALEALHESDVEMGWTVVLNSDEETGSFCSEHVLREQAREHDFGVVVEPALADGSLALERMGSGQFKIEVHGRSAHVGRAFAEGVSAVTRLGELLGALGKLAKPEAGRIVNVGPLIGGTVTNAVPDYAACWGNVRFADRACGEDLEARLDGLATPSDAMPAVVVHRHWNRPAKPTTEPVRVFAETAREIAEALGQRLPFAATGGVCDGNILQDEGLPTLDTLGVRGGNLHRTDEFIELASLVERAQLLAVLLRRIAAGRVV